MTLCICCEISYPLNWKPCEQHTEPCSRRLCISWEKIVSTVTLRGIEVGNVLEDDLRHDSTPRGCVAISGNIFDCPSWEGDAEVPLMILECIGTSPPQQN